MRLGKSIHIVLRAPDRRFVFFRQMAGAHSHDGLPWGISIHRYAGPTTLPDKDLIFKVRSVIYQTLGIRCAASPKMKIEHLFSTNDEIDEVSVFEVSLSGLTRISMGRPYNEVRCFTYNEVGNMIIEEDGVQIEQQSIEIMKIYDGLKGGEE